MLAIAGEFEDDVDHMFEEFGTGDVTLFGDVTDNEKSGIGTFGGFDEEVGAVTDLRGASWGGSVGVRKN